MRLIKDGVILATASVTSNGSSWSYVNITPIAVTPGQRYVVAVETAGLTYSRSTGVVLPALVGSIQLDGATYVSGTGIPDNNIQTSTILFGFGDVTFIPGSPLPPPAAADKLVASPGSGSIGLVWNDNSTDETGFTIERKTGAGAFAVIANPAANATSFNDIGLQPVTIYTYRVIATNFGGDASPSNESTAISPSVITQTPWGSAAPASTGINQNWNYALGYHFTPVVDGQVTALGGRFNGTKIVKLFNKATGVELAQAPVTSANSFAYTPLATPVDVTAGTTYTVAVYMAGSGGSYVINGIPSPTTYGNIRIESSTFAFTGSNPNAIPVNAATSMYGQADIQFQASAVGPASFVYGMWNWDSTILGDNTRIAALIQYNLDLGITDLGFAINWNQPFSENPNTLPALRDMLTRFHNNGIKVEMVAGDAAWVDRGIFNGATGGTTGIPLGGFGFDFGKKLIDRFVAYQDAEWNAAQPNPCLTCFDGIRLDVEPHGLRQRVTNSMLIDANDPRIVPGGPDAVAISGFVGEPLLWTTWDQNFNNGFDFDTGLQLSPGAFVDTPVATRNLILAEFWQSLVHYKSQIQDDRGPGHITHDPAAVAAYLSLATDQVPWYWTVGVQDSTGAHIVPETPLMVDHDNDPATADIEVWKAALSVPDRVALMGYRDQYEHIDPVTGTLFWFRSVKQWDEGNNLDDPAIGLRGALPYLDSIGKPTSVGLETISQQQLGFNSKFVTFGEDHTDPLNHPRDPYSQMKNMNARIGSDLMALYPNALEGIRYHEYYEPIPGKSSDAGDFFPTFSTWAGLEIFPNSQNSNDNLADWQTFHNVTPTTANLPVLNSVPTVPDGDALTLTLTNFMPGPGLTGVVQATVNGLPIGMAANDFHIVAFVKVLGDTNYFQGGKGFATTVGGLAPAQNGQLDAAGNFEVRPIRIGDPTVSKIVWWFDLLDSNGHFIRRFTLDPIDHCFNDTDPTNGCVPLTEIKTDRFYDPQDPLNIDIRDLIAPAIVDLTFANITVSGDIQKSVGTDIGVISGDITNFTALGLNPTDFHVRTWVEFTHDGHDAAANTDPNWKSEVNVWSLLSSDVPIDASGHFVASNLRPINPTGDSDAFGGTNGTYKLWISVHDDTDTITRIGCPDGVNGIKPSLARFLDMDFSLLDVQAVPTSTNNTGTAGIDLDVQLISVDNTSGLVVGNATGLDPTKTYHAYVWTEFYNFAKNIWQERAEPIGINTVDIAKGGYFQVPITQVIPPILMSQGVNTSTPRNIWVSIHDRPLDLNEFPIIPNTPGTTWAQCGGANPFIDLSGAFPLWLGRFFHMDSSFDYYEGFRPATQTGARNTAAPTAVPNGASATALDAFTVKLDWNDASTNEAGFKVEQRVNGGAWTEVVKVAGKAGSTNAMTWTFDGLSPNTVYDFRIRAFNVSGAGSDLDSGYSTIASVTTPAVGPITLVFDSSSSTGAAGWVKATLTNLPVGKTYRVHTWIEPNTPDATQYHQGIASNVQNGIMFNTDDGISTCSGLWVGTASTLKITVHDASLDTIGTCPNPHPTTNQAGLSNLPGVVAVFTTVATVP